MNLNYRKHALAFIADDALTYQLLNFSRIDVHQTISKSERKTYGIFIAQGITALIEAYIMDDEIKEIPLSTYLTYSRNSIKDYIERLIQLKDSQQLSGRVLAHDLINEGNNCRIIKGVG